MTNYSVESYINSVVRALGVGASIEDIHDALIDKGCQEPDAFLIFKAGQHLYNSMVALELEISKRPKPFGRK